jgi:hypothetical protein
VNHERNEPESVPINPERERRELEAAGWERIEERSGKVVWQHPTSGALYPQGAALARLRMDLASEDAPDEESGGAERKPGSALLLSCSWRCSGDVRAPSRRARAEEWDGVVGMGCSRSLRGVAARHEPPEVLGGGVRNLWVVKVASVAILI